MIKLNSSNEFFKDGVEMGRVIDGHIYSKGQTHSVGIVVGNHIEHDGVKIAWVDGSNLVDLSGRRVSLSTINKHVTGGSISELERAALRLLFADERDN